MKHAVKHLFDPPSTTVATGILFRYSAILLAALAFVAWVPHPLAVVASSIVVAVCLKAFNNVIHECSHNSFSRSRAYNERVGNALCVPLFMEFRYYKTEHSSHHQYLGNYDRDIDFKARRHLGHDRAFTLRRVFMDVISLQFLRSYWPVIDAKSSVNFVSALLHVAVIGGLYYVHANDVAAALILADFIFLPTLRYLIDIVDHGGLYRPDVDEIYKSSNFIVHNLLLRGIFFPRNDCYHLIHHLYPYLPVHNFGKAHAVLMEDPVYASLQHEGDIFSLSRRRIATFSDAVAS